MAYRGETFVVKLGDGATPTETFTTVGGLRSNGLQINMDPIDVSDKTNQGWSSSMAGLRKMTINGSGIMKADAILDALRGHARNRTAANYQIVNENNDIWQGSFYITSWEESGEINGEHSYSFTLENDGAVTYTPGP